jgi:hypothetical protein
MARLQNYRCSILLSGNQQHQGLLFQEERGVLMMVYQEKIAPPDPLPVLSEPSDVLLSQRTIESLKQENAWLKERLAHISRVSAEQPTERP